MPSSLEQLFSLFFFCKARRRRAGMCDHREQIPRRERHPVTSARGCATIGSKSPGESVIPSHPHVDVRPSGANPPERASSRHIRTWMCDHREQIPRRERHPVTSARGCATTGANSFRRSHRNPRFSYSFGRSNAVACCTGVEPLLLHRKYMQISCSVGMSSLQSACPVGISGFSRILSEVLPPAASLQFTLLFSYA